MAELVWSNRARQSLLDIYVAIGMHNPAAAERVYARVEAVAARLAQHPRIGRRRPDIGPNVRALVERPYLILYEIAPEENENSGVERVEIVNVFDGRRDLSEAL